MPTSVPTSTQTAVPAPVPTVVLVPAPTAVPAPLPTAVPTQTKSPTVSPAPTTPQPTAKPTLSPTDPGESSFLIFAGSFQVDSSADPAELNEDGNFTEACRDAIVESLGELELEREEVTRIEAVESRRRRLLADNVIVEYTIVRLFAVRPGSPVNVSTLSANFTSDLNAALTTAVTSGDFQATLSESLRERKSTLTLTVDVAETNALTAAGTTTLTTSTPSPTPAGGSKKKKKKKKKDDQTTLIIILLVVLVPVGILCLAAIYLLLSKSLAKGDAQVEAQPAGGSKVAPEAHY